MDAQVTREDWVSHLQQELEQDRQLRQHSADLRHIQLALFGDAEIPDSLRNAILPTMTRLNTWLDMIGRTGKVVGAAITAFASLVIAAKAMGWLGGIG